MSTLKATKDKARFVSNPISQDVLDTDWVDHEVVTKYKLPEIVIESGDNGDGTLNTSSTDIVEAMSSATNSQGSVISSSFDSGYDAFHVFKNDVDSTSYNDLFANFSTSTGYIGFEFNEPVIINKYSLKWLNVSANTDRMPRDWQLQGSNNVAGDVWVDIGAGVSGETGWTQNERRYYTVTNTTLYSAYRINITANNGNVALSIDEFELIPSLAGTTESLLVSPTEITTGDKLKVLDGANIVERTAGTVGTGGGLVPPLKILSTIGSDLTLSNTSKTITRANIAASWLNSNAYTSIHNSGTVIRIDSIGMDACGVSQSNTYQTWVFSDASVTYRVAYTPSGNVVNGGTLLATYSTYTSTDKIGVEYNYATGLLSFYKNDVFQGSPLTMPNNTAMYFAFGVASQSGSGSLQDIDGTLYQAPITATTNIPTKAFFNKTIDTTLSAEATGKCKSSTVTQIGVL